MEPKFLLASKTVLFNLFSLGLYAGQQVLSVHVLDPQTQLWVTAATNIGLRWLTSQPVTLKP